jgi:hypothetical protein
LKWVKKENECSDAFVWQTHKGDLQTGAWIPVSALLGSGLPDALQGAKSFAAARRGMIL